MDLKQYEQKKFALAEIVSSAQAVNTKDSILQSECRELLRRLAEDRFNLMVVGRFSRGKSTLMNALLGGDYLPTGIVPLTSVITTVRYGSRKQIVLHFIDSGLSLEAPLSQLATYVTQQENPGNIKRIAYAEIQLPVEILRRGFFFVDSPGLGSSIIENTLTTERFLPEADAFVLVTSYESPFSEEEDRILHRIRNTNKKLFVVINKQDTVNPQERKAALDFVTERLLQCMLADVSQIFTISARKALEAKLSHKNSALDESGIHTFESELMRFLIEERAESFVTNMYERTMNFLAHASQSAPNPDHAESYKVHISRLHSLGEALLGSADQSRPAIALEEGATNAAFTLHIDPKTGCRICGEVLNAIFRFLSKYQYELTINPQTQLEHARRNGFCSLHTWQYEGISSPQGVCEGYPKLVHSLAAALREIELRRVDKDHMRSLFPTTKTCPACEVRVEAEKRAVKDLAIHAQRAVASKSASVPACCLPHLRMVTESLGPGKVAQDLLQAHASLLERTAEDLQRYALKHNALRRYLASEEERRASQLALLLVSGHRNVSAPWAIEFIL